MKQIVFAIVLAGTFLFTSAAATAEWCYPGYGGYSYRPNYSYQPGYSYRPAYRPVVPAYGVYRPYPSTVWHPRSSVYLGHPSYRSAYRPSYNNYYRQSYRYPANYSNYRSLPRVRVSIGF